MPTQKLQTFRSAAVTPSDTVDIPNPFTAAAESADDCLLFVGGGGDVAVIDAGGSTTTFVGVPSGTFFPHHVKRVLSTGTTATNIVALW